MPSSSAMSVRNTAQSSMTRCQSLFNRDRRDTSVTSTRPTSPSPIAATRRWKPVRMWLPAPDRPRSSSMTSIRGAGQPFKPGFAGLDPLERGFPAFLKLGGDQTIVGIARRIAAFGQRGLVASLLQLEISDALSFVSAFHPPSLSFQRGLDGHRLHDE